MTPRAQAAIAGVAGAVALVAAGCGSEGDAAPAPPAPESRLRLDLDGVQVVRARLDLSPTNEPGFLFGAFVRGSLVTYLGLQPPLADAE